jgi:hypothetical protein
MSPDAAVYLGTIAAFAFVIKSAILFNVQIKDRTSQAFVLLCLFFVFQNAVEFLGYFTYLKSTSLGELFVHLYLLATYFVFPSLLVFSLALTGSKWFARMRLAAYSLSCLFALAHAGGFVVDGFIFLGWSVITEPGPLYWIVMSYILLCCAFAVLHLVYQLQTNTSQEVRQNARVALWAFTPIIAVAAGVLGLRLLGFNSSSAVSLPIATVVFLYIMLLHTNGNLFWFSTKLKSILVIMKMDHNVSFDAIICELEKVRIHEALKLTEGQQNHAAELLGIPASTLNKRLHKYHIDAEVFKR